MTYFKSKDQSLNLHSARKVTIQTFGFQTLVKIESVIYLKQRSSAEIASIASSVLNLHWSMTFEKAFGAASLNANEAFLHHVAKTETKITNQVQEDLDFASKVNRWKKLDSF